jgi:hypothetical protein
MAGLDPTSLRSWARLSQPILVTGPCQWLAPSRLFYVCMNCAKVIKLPSHCSSSFLQCEKEKNRVLQPMISGVGFLMFSLFFLHTNMYHFIYRNWER